MSSRLDKVRLFHPRIEYHIQVDVQKVFKVGYGLGLEREQEIVLSGLTSAHLVEGPVLHRLYCILHLVLVVATLYHLLYDVGYSFVILRTVVHHYPTSVQDAWGIQVIVPHP